MTIPVGRRASGILLAIGRAEREGSAAPLVAWLREQDGVALDVGECVALADLLEGAAIKRPARRPPKLAPQDAGRILAIWREFYRTPVSLRGRAKALVLALAEMHRVSRRTIESLARKARAIKAPVITPATPATARTRQRLVGARKRARS